jgi:hypothetical protein
VPPAPVPPRPEPDPSLTPLGGVRGSTNRAKDTGAGTETAGIRSACPSRTVPARGYCGPTCLARSPSDSRQGSGRGSEFTCQGVSFRYRRPVRQSGGVQHLRETRPIWAPVGRFCSSW